MTPAVSAALVAALTALAAWALTGLVAWSGPVDTVKARSSHVRPTPTGGGVAILAATTGATALLLSGLAPSPELAVLIACAAGVGLFGVADDLLDLRASTKLLVHVAVSVLTAWLVGYVSVLPLAPDLTLTLPPLLGLLGSALFLLVLLNAVNFMDGADGLAGGAAAVACSGLATAAFLMDEPAIGAAAAAATAAGVGFLPWNLSRRVFQGDVGAFFSALWIGGLGLLLAARGAVTPFLVAFTVLPLLVDVLLTLIVRARRGESLFEAHREHLYQLWLRGTGRPHAALAARVWGLMTVTTVTGVLLELYAPGWALAGLLVAIAVLSAAWARIRARLLDAIRRKSGGAEPRADRRSGSADRDRAPSR